MIVHQVSKEAYFTLEEKITKVNTYDVSELLRVLRACEENPRKFEEDVIKAVYDKLFDRNIMCV